MTGGMRGRVVLVTGVGRPGQVGEAVVGALAEAGAALVLIEREAALADAHLATLRARGTDAVAVPCDLTDAAAVERAAAEVTRKFPGGLHALVHLAGGFAASGPVAESDPTVWHRQVAINLTTAYLTTRAFLPLLRQARGSIVFFSSAAALPGGAVANLSAYAAAKAALLTLMRAIAAEERDTGVRANALAPTAIRTQTNVADMGDKVRYVERDTVARWVLQLVDPDSGPVTGQVIKLG